MTGVVREGQEGVLVYFREDFLDEIDKRISEHGCSNRSELIRLAVIEKLNKKGAGLNIALATAPMRSGKTYGRTKSHPKEDKK